MMKEYDAVYPGYDFARTKSMEQKHILKESKNRESAIFTEEHL